jgi:hypothetical protein
MANPVSAGNGRDPSILAAGVVHTAAGASSYATAGAGANAVTAAWGAAGAIVRNGAGSWTITLAAGGVEPATALLQVQALGIGATGTHEIQATLTNDTTLDVRAFAGGVATDMDFNFSIRVLGR